MTSIDLYDDFNEEEDQLMGDREEDDNQNDEEGPENTSLTKKDEVDHGIKVVKVKRKLVTLNAERLKGPRGIIAVDEFFPNMKLKGRGYEKDDLKDIMKRLEHWAHRMFPKYHFDDSLSKIERLGRKKEIAIHMTRYRMGQLTKDDEDQRVLSDDDNEMERNNSTAQDMPFDEFDQLLDQQIALSTSALPSTTTLGNISGISGFSQIPQSSQHNQTTSSSSIQQPQQSQQQSQKIQLTDEQKARIEENKKRALALREAHLRQQEEELSLKRQHEEDEQKKSSTQVFSDLLFDDDFV